MPLSVGEKLGPYEIVELIGAGGMGEVYRARDTRLDRMVAIKVLPAGKVADVERRQRFVQEAKAASALNHPHIVTIHDISNDNGIDFIVMEYVPGKALDQLIPNRGMRAQQALKYAIQIADALTKAHGAGIVHRDLKPANIMVTPEDQVKVLDFGLAKLTAASVGPDDPTRTGLDPSGAAGAIVGTIAYMSPEQAEGKPVDARSDIFSFGTVLYETLTGRKAFSGDSSLSTLSAILRQEPRPVSEIVPDVARDLEKIVQRCLRKDRDRRFQSMADLKVALTDLKEESESGASAADPAKVKVLARKLSVYAALAASVLLIAVGAWWTAGRHTSAPQIIPITTSGSATDPAFSPDGKLIAYSDSGPSRDNYDIYVQQIGVGSPLRLTTDPGRDFSPVFSPDGRYIAFTRSVRGMRNLMLIPVLGGQERKLGPVIGPYIDFSPDGKTIAVTDRESEGKPLGIFLVSMADGNRRRLTNPAVVDDGSPFNTNPGDYQPRFSPDGTTIALFRRLLTSSVEVCVASVRNGETRVLARSNTDINGLAWMPDGREVVYATAVNGPLRMWTVRVSGANADPLSAVGEGVESPAISRVGQRLAYVHQSRELNIWRMDLAAGAAGASGNPVKLVGSTRVQFNPSYSPDGKKIAFSSERSGNSEIWITNSDGSSPVQLTSLGWNAGSPRWAPDSRRIVFDFAGTEKADVYVVDSEGGAPRRLTNNPASDFLPSWSADGKWIYFASDRTGGKNQIWRMSAEGGGETQLTHGGGSAPRESPDGKALYYVREGTLWKIAPEGGAESPVEGSPTGLGILSWIPADDGLYFLKSVGRLPADGIEIRFLSFASREATALARFYKNASGLSISSDREHAIFAQTDRNDTDIMLVENFR